MERPFYRKTSPVKKGFVIGLQLSGKGALMPDSYGSGGSGRR
jgi:hypothetical protein